MTRAPQLIKLFTDRSIPVNSPEDVLCLFRHAFNLATSSPEFIKIQAHLHLHVPQLSSPHAFQALELVSRNPRLVSPKLIQELKEVLLLHRFDGLSHIEFVRAISLLCSMQGPGWDPEELRGINWQDRLSKLAPVCLVSLCKAGCFGVSGMQDRALSLFRLNKLSDLEASQLAFWTGNYSLVPKEPSLFSIPFILSGYSAWNWDDSSLVHWENQILQSLDKLTPLQIQTTLLAILAREGVTEQSSTLFERSGHWVNFIEKHLCKMKMNSAHLPPYPIRLPQLALTRKCKNTTDLHYEGKFILDSHNGKPVQFVTFENDPKWRIVRNFLPPNIQTIVL